MYQILEDNSKETEGLTILDYYSKKLTKYGWTSRKITGNEKEYFRARSVIAFVIKQINAHGSKETIIKGWNINMDKILIPNEYKLCVNNSEVRAQLSSAWCEDLTVRPEFVEDWTFTFEFGEGENKVSEQIKVDAEMYETAIATIRRHHKKEFKDELTSLDDLRRPCTLTDVFARVISDGMVAYSGNPFIPLELNANFKGIFKSTYWSATVKEVIDDQVRALFT